MTYSPYIYLGSVSSNRVLVGCCSKVDVLRRVLNRFLFDWKQGITSTCTINGGFCRPIGFYDSNSLKHLPSWTEEEKKLVKEKRVETSKAVQDIPYSLLTEQSDGDYLHIFQEVRTEQSDEYNYIHPESQQLHTSSCGLEQFVQTTSSAKIWSPKSHFQL